MSADGDTRTGANQDAGVDRPADPTEVFRKRFLPRYAHALAECEQRLERIAGHPRGLMGQSCAETLAAGGKRLRPLLVFLAAPAATTTGEEIYAAAVAVELVHMATLVHDDVLDNAMLRRGQPTMFARHGAGVSTSAGDYLFSSAFGVLAATGSGAAANELACTSLDLSRGELMQMHQAFDYCLGREQYYERCRLKTSGLFATACRLGAMLSGASEASVAALGDYGESLGLAFQIADDILDYSGNADRSGKLTGTDLKDGTVTLPLILAIENNDSILLMLEDELSDERVADICSRVTASGALEQAAQTAYGYVEQARSALQDAACEVDIEPLKQIATAAVDRDA